MTVTDVRVPLQAADYDESTVTRESAQVATLRRMLDDPAEQGNRPEIERAIAYLTVTSVLGA